MWGSDDNALKRARFAKLVKQHTASLDAAARRICRDLTAAKDLIQDTLERAWKSFDSLQGDDKARSWLIKIMKNIWFDKLRRKHAEVPLDEADEPVAPVADEPEHWETISIDQVRRAIEQVDEPFRSVAVLHFVDGLANREIAERLRIPYATAATRLHRARRMIAKLLGGKLDHEEEP